MTQSENNNQDISKILPRYDICYYGVLSTKKIPRARCVASLAKMVSSTVTERFCIKILDGGQLRKPPSTALWCVLVNSPRLRRSEAWSAHPPTATVH